MKKKIILMVMLLMCCLAGSAYAADVTVTVDGKELAQKGVIVDGRTMVPIRDIAEAMGVEVEYNADSGRVYLSHGEVRFASMQESIYLIIDVVEDNGKYVQSGTWVPYDSDVPMQNIGGKMMMPLKVAAEMLDADISWDGTNYIASVTQKPKSAVTTDGKIDLMSDFKRLNDGEAVSILKERGFEVTSLVAYKNEYGNGWCVDCTIKNITDTPISAELYMVVEDKAELTKQSTERRIVEMSSRLYDEAWEPNVESFWAEIFFKFDPEQHFVLVVAQH